MGKGEEQSYVGAHQLGTEEKTQANSMTHDVPPPLPLLAACPVQAWHHQL